MEGMQFLQSWMVCARDKSLRRGPCRFREAPVPWPVRASQATDGPQRTSAAGAGAAAVAGALTAFASFLACLAATFLVALAIFLALTVGLATCF